MEGSFDNDVLIGDSRPNSMLGQPGQDEFYGNGGDDIIDARDGRRDFVIQCGRHPSQPAGHALTDSFDPPDDGLRRDHPRDPGQGPRPRRGLARSRLI